MKKPNFKQYKFRASSIAKLMVNSRKKSDPLSETTKSYLQEIFIEEVFGRKKVVTTPAMQKGTIVESDSLDIVQKAHGFTYFKNNKRFENEYTSGTPDVIDKKNSRVVDIKSSWDLWSFFKVDSKVAKKNYYYQVLTYMWLTNTKKASLMYTLTNTPEHLMYSESQKLSYSIGQEQAEEITRNNHTFDDIPDEIRVKEFKFEYEENEIVLIIEKIKLCREYLSNMSI